jgi:hypothetical protein
MADVAILHTADKQAAAARLAEAIADAGFDVGAVEIEDPAGLADAVDGCSTTACILIWSRPLVSHALHSGDLPRIRQLSGLIEVSADGIAPPSRGDDSRVVSISGWRGQPFHPGWQRIHFELKRLCGARKAAPEAPPPPAVSPNPPPQRTEPAAAGNAPRPQARLMLSGGIALLLVAGAVGAATWLGSAAPDDRPRQEFRETRPSDAIANPPRPGLGVEPASPNAPMNARPASDPPSSPSPERLATAEAKPDPSQPRRALRPASTAPVGRPGPRPLPQAGSPKKYSRKYSKVMREFCERSGRSTPQCRTFRRSIDADRTKAPPG